MAKKPVVMIERTANGTIEVRARETAFVTS